MRRMYEDFYMTLTSSDPKATQIFMNPFGSLVPPLNEPVWWWTGATKNSFFSNELPFTVNLEGDWEVAIRDIHIDPTSIMSIGKPFYVLSNIVLNTGADNLPFPSLSKNAQYNLEKTFITFEEPIRYLPLATHNFRKVDILLYSSLVPPEPLFTNWADNPNVPTQGVIAQTIITLHFRQRQKVHFVEQHILQEGPS